MKPASLKSFFSKIQRPALWLFWSLSPVALLSALYFSPNDYLHGALVRIMYVHVPAAWLSVSIYVVMGIFSFISLILRSSFYSICAKSLAFPGCALTLICIITGSIWGKFAWGTWWVWDARLTSVIVLFFLYVGYLNFCENGSNQAASFLNVIGLVNIPIIKWSVNWWFTLHQPSSFSLTQRPTIAIEMLVPLLLMTIVFICWTVRVFTKQFDQNLMHFQRGHYETI